MPETRGNALAYAGASTHRPLPRADEKTYRAAHQQQPAKPTSTFDWNWNKADCTTCQTKTPKADLVDGQCPTCRGLTTQPTLRADSAQPNRRPRPTKRLEHSKGGDQVYVPYEQNDLDRRFTAPTTTPALPDPPAPAGGHAPGAPVEPPAAREVTAAPPAGPAAPAAGPDLLAMQLDHATATLTRAHGNTDPVVGLFRNAVLSQIAALDLYLELHHPTTQPGPSSGLGGNQLAAASQGEGERQPARFQTFEKPPRRTRGPRRDVDHATLIREYVDDHDSIKTIAQRHHIGVRRARDILTAAKVHIRDDRGGNNRINHTPEVIADVVRRYRDEQQSVDRIRTDTGIERRQVRAILTGAGVAIRPGAHLSHPTLSSAQQTEAVELYLQGQPLVDIGHRFGVRSKTIRSLVIAAGHPIRPKGASRQHAARLVDLGVNAAQVKAWAVREGLLPKVTTGMVAARIVDAYAAAHQPPDETGDPA